MSSPVGAVIGDQWDGGGREDGQPVLYSSRCNKRDTKSESSDCSELIKCSESEFS